MKQFESFDYAISRRLFMHAKAILSRYPTPHPMFHIHNCRLQIMRKIVIKKYYFECKRELG